MAAMNVTPRLIVGITNPDPLLSSFDDADPERSDPSNNPLSYFERLEVIRGALTQEGVDRSRFEIVPFPISRPELLRNYVPASCVFHLTIYDRWGERKHELLAAEGFEVNLLWRRPLEEKGVTGKDVRARIADGRAWEHLVPAGAVKALRSLGIEQRLAASDSEPGT
jgi:nicotinamide-nucleotide adenylyltransferase